MFPPVSMTQTFGQDPSTQEIPSQSDPRTREIAGGRYSGQNENALLDRLTDKIIAQESSGRSWIVGKQGEIGLGQIMPSTAAQYGVQAGDLYNPKVNRALTRRILGDLYQRFNGNLFLTAAAYNTGPGNVRRGRIPSSTRAYASKAIQGLGDVFGGTPAYAEEPPPVGEPTGPFTKAPTTILRGAEPTAAPTPMPAARWAAMMGPGAGAAPAGAATLPAAGGLGEGPPAAPPAARRPQGPIDMSRLAAMTGSLPPDRQKQIRDKALAINERLAQTTADPAIRKKLIERGGLSVATVKLLKSGESPEDIATDIKHPYYGYIRRPGTKLVGKIGGALWPRFGPSTPEYDRQVRDWMGHTFMPQTPTTAALMAAAPAMGWVEAAPELLPEVEQGLEGLSAARQMLRPAVSTLPRRMLGMAGVGAGASAATGDNPIEGAETGVEFQAPAEVVGGVLGGLGKLGLGPALTSQTERDISRTIGENLPKRPSPAGDAPFNIRDWKLPDRAFDQVQEALRPSRQEVYNRVRGKKFPMLKVEAGVKPTKWNVELMSLPEVEKNLTELSKLGYLKSGLIKEATYSTWARDQADFWKNATAGRMDPQTRKLWVQNRAYSAKANAYQRLFKETEALDPNTGVLDQPKLAQGIKDQYGDLQRQLGRKGVEDLWVAATRLKPRGPLYRGSPYKGAYKDRPGHFIPRVHLYPEPGHFLPSVSLLPELPHPIGNVPIWMYPPRGALAPFVGPPTVKTLNEATQYPPAQQRQEGGPVAGGQPYVVGERGPELFVPPTGGQIAPTERLRQMLAGQGPEDKYGSFGDQPLEAMRAGQVIGPRDRFGRVAENFATGGMGGIVDLPESAALREMPQLSKSARGMIKYARKFGVEPENIATLARRFRAGTISKEEFSTALKDLRARMPEPAKAAAVIRKYAAKETPVEVRAAVSQLMRAGKITLQQAEKMLKAITG